MTVKFKNYFVEIKLISELLLMRQIYYEFDEFCD
jgi:hypothetical protein